MHVTPAQTSSETPFGARRRVQLPAPVHAARPAADHAELTSATAEQSRTARPMPLHRRSAPFLAQLACQNAGIDERRAERINRQHDAASAYGRRPVSARAAGTKGAQADMRT
ncbi:MAG: hypothetical protein VX871_03260 [Pseudomonadota bacterium]|nr:hypothetical protein [Pseudomonadota bacterium]